MKALALYGQKDARFLEKEIPHAGENQLVVKINYVGICGTDVEFYQTGQVPPFIHLPIVLGHENVGTVVEIGPDVTDYKVGDMILCGPPTHCAEDCPSCRQGKTNICIHSFPRTAGLGGPDGGYAPYMLVPDVKHTMLVKVPEGVDPKDAVLFDVIAVALHGVRLSHFKFGDNVVVSGTGPIGLSAIQCLKAAGANKIIVLGTTSSKEPILREYGADYFINSKECEDIAGEIQKILGSPVGADVVFECAGNMTSLANCMYQCVKPGGQVCVIGTIQQPMSNLVPGQFSPSEPNVQFSFTYTEDDVKIYLDMAASGKMKFPGMVTDVISLDNAITDGLDRKDRKGQLKILIDPSL